MSKRDEFIEGLADALKENIAIATGSMDIDPKLIPIFKLGMSMGVSTLLELTTLPTSDYRIYPTTKVVKVDPDPIDFYDHTREKSTGGINHLVNEIWDKVST